MDTSALDILQDPASLIVSRSADSTLLDNVSGGTSMVNHIAVLTGEVLVDGVHEFAATRDNPGQNDKAGFLIGVIDTSDVTNVVMVGVFETSGGEERNHAVGTTVQFASLADATAPRLLVRVESGKVYAAIGDVDGTVVPINGFAFEAGGDIKLAVGYRRGSSPGAQHPIEHTIQTRRLR